MDPRTLVAPTAVVSVLILATLGVLMIGIPEKGEREVGKHAMDWDDPAAMKKAFVKDYETVMYQEFVFKAIVGSGFCLVAFWPFSHEKPNILVRAIILTFCVLVAAFLSGDQMAAHGALFKIMVMGGVLIAGMFIARLFNKIAPMDSKEPCSLRWAARHRTPPEEEDPDAVDKLERMREIAAESPPVFS